jgi:hypothetical protein
MYSPSLASVTPSVLGHLKCALDASINCACPARAELKPVVLYVQDSESSQLTAALKFPSPPDAPALEAALKALAARHDLLRTRFARSARSDKATLQARQPYEDCLVTKSACT